jgi:hypothetical protein
MALALKSFNVNDFNHYSLKMMTYRENGENTLSYGMAFKRSSVQSRSPPPENQALTANVVGAFPFS